MKSVVLHHESVSVLVVHVCEEWRFRIVCVLTQSGQNFTIWHAGWSGLSLMTHAWSHIFWWHTTYVDWLSCAADLLHNQDNLENICSIVTLHFLAPIFTKESNYLWLSVWFPVRLFLLKPRTSLKGKNLLLVQANSFTMRSFFSEMGQIFF